jgi:hypothetical protein
MDFNPPLNDCRMTATNINIDEFINILTTLRANGHKLIDLDMIPDENHPSMNKLVIHPVHTQQGLLPAPQEYYQQEHPSIIRNPNINRDNNDIFDSFKL